MTITTTRSSQLARRMMKYLLAKNCWVSKKLLIELANMRGYSYADIRKAINEVENEVNVGTDYISAGDKYSNKPVGSYLRCYPMDEEMKKQRRQMLDEFDFM